MRNKKSRSLDLKKIRAGAERFLDVVSEDRVPVYAAQASFFLVISAIPFIILLINLIGSFIPEGVADVMISMGDALPENLRDLYLSIIGELYSKPAVNLISITALTAFWMASRGISSVRGGISTVYRSHPDEGIVKGFLMSAAYTAVFLVLLIVIVVAQLFGSQLYLVVKAASPGTVEFLDAIFRLKTPILYVSLSAFFALLYYAVNRRGEYVDRKFYHHLPGAIFAAAGWMLFSYFYSLYTTYFTGVSYIYGSLTAVVLLLLWMYVCMTILLIGAELNKLIAGRDRKRKIRGTDEQDEHPETAD
ncbi:MAG: YihY/virulence factor BrkB family protein [Clostridia bacterium]|nr:YihY/virulence factor BrkB family protein [Clostridia bacterium]